MTATEKATYVERASSLRLSLGQFFREAGASYVNRTTQRDEEEALEAALKQLEWSHVALSRPLIKLSPRSALP